MNGRGRKSGARCSIDQPGRSVLAKKKIFIFGASGHAKVVIDIVERADRYEIAFLVDDNPALSGVDFFGYRVIGTRNDLLAGLESLGGRPGLIGVGDNRTREMIAQWLADQEIGLVSAVHPSVQLARGVEIGAGTVIMPGAVVNSDARIGRNVIINTGAVVEHDCVVADGVHLAPGAILCGNAAVGTGAFVGAGAVVVQGVAVGRGAVVGAGSTVVDPVPDFVRVAGTPAVVLGG